MFSIPGEFNTFLDILTKLGETLSGVNSVARGAPAQNITSGSMAALVESMSVRYNSPIEQCSNQTWEKLGTTILKIYQCMATEDQIISIAGKDKAWTATTFTKESIGSIMNVTVKQVSAMAKTTSGRADIADKLLTANMFNDPREYLNVLATGNLEPYFSGPVNLLSTIKAEGEALLRGESPQAVEFENHQLHIREHLELLDQNTRQVPQLLAAINAHIKQHFDLWNQMSMEAPDMCAAIGIPPLPGAAAMGSSMRSMQGMGDAPPQAGPNPQQQPNSQQQDAPKPGPAPTGAPGQVPGKMPRMPKPAAAPGQPQQK